MPDLPEQGLEIWITIGSDGRLYFPDMPEELFPIVQAICPTDEAVLARCVTLTEQAKVIDAR